MVRLVAIAPLILLAGCMTIAATSPAPQLAGIGEIRLGLTEMDGVPPAVQEMVFEEVERAASLRGIPFNSGPATLAITGYLTLVAGASGTLAIYVFDFTGSADASGERLLRVGGQVPTVEAAADPWDAIDRNLVIRMVGHLFQEFDAWLAANAVGA